MLSHCHKGQRKHSPSLHEKASCMSIACVQSTLKIKELTTLVMTSSRQLLLMESLIQLGSLDEKGVGKLMQSKRNSVE